MATIYDVAKEARVSVASVSAAINGKEGEVGPETKQRIMAAILKMDYRPNLTARQLTTGKFDTIAFVYESPTMRWASSLDFPKVFTGVSDAAAKAELDLLFLTSVRKRAFADVIDNMDSQGVDGGIILGPIPLKQNVLDAIERCKVPLVCLDAYRAFSRASTLDVDNVAAMRQAMEHLLSAGHKRIVYIGNSPIYQCFVDRIQAFCEAMQEHDLPVDGESIRIVNGENVESCVNEMISRSDRPTAIVIGRGEQGLSAWNALTAAGMKVPRDISLVIYDNLPEGHPGCDVVLQAVPEQLYEKGKTATELLVRVISGEITSP